MTDGVMPQAQVLRELLGIYSSISPAERKVADEILARPRDVIHLTAEELARQAQVSQPVTSRLCRRLSTKTFSGFKVGLAQQIGTMPQGGSDATAEGGLGSDLTIDDPEMAAIVADVRDELATALRALASLDQAALRAAAEALATAGTTILCGFDLSGSVAWRLASLLRLEGLRARPEYDYQSTPSVSELGADDVLVVITYRGNTPQLRSAVAQAKERDVTVIVVTNEAKFDIGADPDIVLLTHAPSATTEEKYVAGPALHVQLAVARALWRMTRAVLGREPTT